ncbi:NADH-quinone oxidoreductase subunit NuoG [Solimicrobium silvestre]|uniref:NADH-quinone oxidoreductase n=1 Tax=Solimicrobium silvestre TaxID=2099400 RepID=A0A2S9GVD6_9BURK|nr:NADH-quinone oxidoreductase subunit NuoG [Solimicrobium silvestre]PRC91692.1 NuoG: NADH dehydrogenase (quinone), G subunit [Solimicrobium silvestre]
MVEIEIDGKKVEVPPGSMVMDAANKLGTYIPHFCYHKKLSIAASCRMCLVEVEKAPKPLPACATPVTAGMIVRSKSDKAVKAQKEVMEFLLINHPLDCPICDQGGECQLQDLAVGYGKSSSRYEEEKRVVFHKNAGPLISMEDMTRCIHCTRCVRFGQEIAGVMELGMLGRGEHAEITTFVGKTIDSELSGNMIDICPVGALTSKPFRYSARTWELSRRKSVSPHDGLGSNLIVQVKNNKVMRVLPLENEAVNECWITDKDRFSYEALNSEQRLTKPMIKQGGQWQETDWQTALEYVAHGLKNIKHEHGAAAIGALATPHSTLEELSLLQKVIRGMGSENIDFRLRASDDTVTTGFKPWLGMPIAEFAELTNVLVIGSFLRKDHPLLAARLRHSTKVGSKISILHASDDDLLMPVANKLICAPSAWLSALTEIMLVVAEAKGVTAPVAQITISDAARAIAADLLAGDKNAIMLGNAVTQHPQATQLHAVAQWIAEQTGIKFGYLTEAANTVGGYIANALPGQNGLNAQQMLTQARKAYVLLNADPLLDCATDARPALEQAEMVIVLSAFKQALDYADVLLPIAPFTETSGTFVNCEGRAQSFNGAVKPLGDTRPAWKVLRVLGNLLGIAGFDYETSESVRDELLQKQTDLSSLLNNKISLTVSGVDKVTPVAGFERISNVAIYSTDALARRSEALQETADAKPPRAWMAAAHLTEMGLVDGDIVKVSQAGRSVLLPVSRDKGLPAGVVRVAAGHPVTASLGAMFGQITVERA